jgi:uncharacterized protein (DUF58 family)
MAPPAGRPGWRWTSWPRRTLWPTRDGWWCLAAAVGLGFAAMNTGNNLLYLLVSMLLGLIIVSGIFSEQTIRRLGFAAVLPDEVFAGRPALLGARVANRKRWRDSRSLTVRPLDGAARPPSYLARLPAGEERLVTWESAFPARGRHAFPRLSVGTRFPFGLFLKSGQVRVEADVVVYPALVAIGIEDRRALGGGGHAQRRRGRGHDLYNLREYRSGDDPRLIHWRSSAKTASLTVRELEADTAVDTRLTLEGAAGDRERVEAALSRAASLAVHLLQAGAGVEVAGPGLAVPMGRGRPQRRAILTALALWEPGAAAPPPAPRGGVREIRVSLG